MAGADLPPPPDFYQDPDVIMGDRAFRVRASIRRVRLDRLAASIASSDPRAALGRTADGPGRSSG
jgi:hypothetical protein